MKLLIVGDIAGQYGALLRLTDKHAKGRKIVLAGDLVDRGPDSKEVVDWARKNTSRVVALKGNHEDMMVDACQGERRYERGIWLMNGGYQTLFSYGLKLENNHPSIREFEMGYRLVPQAHLEWMSHLRTTLEGEGLFISHAPWREDLELGSIKAYRDPDMGPLWNRGMPKERPGVFQVFGHNSSWGLHKLGDWGICLDDTRANKLTGLLWPEREVVQEKY